MFTRSAITPPKVNQIWMKSGALWVHCRGLTLVEFGRYPRSSDSWRAKCPLCHPTKAPKETYSFLILCIVIIIQYMELIMYDLQLSTWC